MTRLSHTASIHATNHKYRSAHSDNTKHTTCRDLLLRVSVGDRLMVRVVFASAQSVLKLSRRTVYSPLNTYAIRYSLLLLGYKPVQHVTVLNTVGNCNTMVSIVILYCNIMGPPSYMGSVVDRNVVMRRMTVFGFMGFALQVNFTELLHMF